MATISGVTRNHDDSVILTGATIRVHKVTDGEVEAEGTSVAGSGRYTITVPVGRYLVVAYKEPNVKAGITGPIDVT